MISYLTSLQHPTFFRFNWIELSVLFPINELILNISFDFCLKRVGNFTNFFVWLTFELKKIYFFKECMHIDCHGESPPDTHVAFIVFGLRESEVMLWSDILTPCTRGPRSGGVIRNTERETRPRTTLMTNTEIQIPLRFCWDGITATSSWNRHGLFVKWGWKLLMYSEYVVPNQI